jgi:hypothetical protein
MSPGPTRTLLSEVPEAEAPPEIAAIYEEIRQLSAIPMVALIYRNLATCPGVLPEVWESLRPLFQSGRIQDAAWRIARENAPGDLVPPIGADARLALGLDEASLPAVLTTFEAYNRTNPINLLAMLCLLARLRSPAAQSNSAAGSARPWSPPPPIPGRLPAMTPPAAIPPHLYDLLLVMQLPGPSGAAQVIPSLYRHLTTWPAFLALLHVVLMPRFRDGSIARATDRMRIAMQEEAEGIAPMLAPLPRLAQVPEAAAIMDRFTTTMIPHMIVIGNAVRRALV